jgi:glutathione peroxidase
MKRIKLLAGVFCLGAVICSGAATPALYDIPLKDIDGQPTSLEPYKGQVLLIVNVASRCGLTPQYKELEALHRKYKAKGFTVLGFPCNDFGAQEPGTNHEIKDFCSANFDVTFPMFDKLHVKGPEQHKLYSALTGNNSPFPGEIKWNFGKFLIGRDGKIIGRFEPKVTPASPEVIAGIEAALAQK